METTDSDAPAGIQMVQDLQGYLGDFTQALEDIKRGEERRDAALYRIGSLTGQEFVSRLNGEVGSP